MVTDKVDIECTTVEMWLLLLIYWFCIIIIVYESIVSVLVSLQLCSFTCHVIIHMNIYLCLNIYVWFCLLFVCVGCACVDLSKKIRHIILCLNVIYSIHLPNKASSFLVFDHIVELKQGPNPYHVSQFTNDNCPYKRQSRLVLYRQWKCNGQIILRAPHSVL